MHVAATQYILGTMPVLSGFIISLCVPVSWMEFSVKRNFRGCEYNISYKKTGTFSVRVNGIEVKGNIIASREAKEVKVEVNY
ncbi:MAG: hypothetical protein CVV21_03650 [Candidatus Goldiibacteriota bacterium HGW-Goldbacteria-1]|jgi:cellobiose phosphorylase|nr:MAG: hypothetical protein CVV21_03650 [Candidatus Goldiibacteriota bacterium HGW-Goldbacteria-1]